MVIIVFTNYFTGLYTQQEAIELCRDTRKNGFIIDALTLNRELQSYLRELMELGHN